MSELQWILVGLGVLVVIAVYMYTRMTRPSDYDYLDNIPPAEDDESITPPRDTAWDDDHDLDWLSRDDADAAQDRPWLDAEPEPPPHATETEPPAEDARDELLQPFPSAKPVAPEMPEVEVRMPAAPAEGQKLVVLYVAAPAGQRFGGDALHSALLECGLHFGPRLIYHRIKEVDGVPESVFSVANMVKPGHLDPMERDRLRTPGLNLFMVLPGPENPVPAYRDMESTAEQLAAQLGGEVLDERRQPLTRQMSRFLQEEMAELERRQLVERTAQPRG